MRNPTKATAISSINKSGALLVFPIKGKSSMPSLWSIFYPGTKMSWDWSEDGDNRVGTLWHLRSKLSTSDRVIYSKWFKNRATLLSFELFAALLSLVSRRSISELKLSEDAQTILNVLNDDSPLASRELKRMCVLDGKENNSRFEKAIKQLWLKFLIVGYGEVEEGGFPSLAVGSTKLLFEDLWDESKNISDQERREVISKYFTARSEFFTQYLRLEKAIILPTD